MKPSDFLTELSNDKLTQYKTAAAADASKADKEGDFKKGDKRFSGIVKATKKQFDNDAKKDVAEGLDPNREAAKTLQNLKNLALIKSALTSQQLRQAGRESMLTDAINACIQYEQSYLQNKQQGNAIFVRALRDEIDNFRKGYPINSSMPEDNSPELGDLLQGKLGKLNFQQGVAEGECPMCVESGTTCKECSMQMESLSQILRNAGIKKV